MALPLRYDEDFIYPIPHPKFFKKKLGRPLISSPILRDTYKKLYSMAIYSIWKDHDITLPANHCPFRVKVGQEVVYNGVAVKRPGASANTIRVNDICADYIANALPLASTLPSLPVTFVVEANPAGTWSVVETLQFINDWSYDTSWSPNYGLSFPILPVVADGQFVPYTRNTSDTAQATIYAGGTSQAVTMSAPTSRKAKFTDSFVRTLQASGWGGVGVDLSSYWAEEIALPNSTRHYAVRSCGIRYVLYYVNAYGGVDWFPILGNAQASDEVENTTIETTAGNTYRTRSRRDIHKTITRSVTLHTGWLKDEESAMMHHLLNSTDVYLHDLQEGKVHPVLLTGTAHQYALFKDNGHRPVEYTIVAQYANKEERR